jgi:heme A synthase
MSQKRFSRYAWGVLIFNIIVVLWGAYVRATGSGAGCGSHWPLCNGEVVPRTPQINTLIEFTHRLSSGLAFMFVLALLIWAWKLFPSRHIIRTGSVSAMIFMIIESMVGAVLVLFQWVAGDTSTARVIVLALHLANTFMLLAALCLTAWWASGGARPNFRSQKTTLLILLLGLVGTVVLGMSGAITALGDTLFPVQSLAEGFLDDFSPTAHIVIRLRIWHPVIAVLLGIYQYYLIRSIWNSKSITEKQKLFSIALAILFVVQLGAGLLNLFLLAPVWLQIVHLLLADLVWITLVLLTGVTLISTEKRQFGSPKSEYNGGN